MVQFKVGESTIEATVLNRSTTTSRHTGEELAGLEVQFVAHTRQQEAVAAALAIGKGYLLSEPPNSAPEIPVSLHQKQVSYTDGRPNQTYIWTLTEIEELALEALQIQEITVEPYKIDYKFDGDALIITARVQIDEGIDQRLRELPLYFPVIRQGIADEPRSMRFGRIIWSETDGNKRKVQLVLVDEVFDGKRSGGGFLEPQFSNVSDSLAITNARLHKLFEALRAKGIFTEEELDQIVVVSDAELRDQKMRFNQVNDLDLFLGNEE